MHKAISSAAVSNRFYSTHRDLRVMCLAISLPGNRLMYKTISIRCYDEIRCVMSPCRTSEGLCFLGRLKERH